MAINRISPKKGKVVDIPDAVITIGTPTAGDAQVSVAFTASSPATGGPVQKYTAISSPGSISATGSTSPIIVTGLTNGTAYTFTVAAGNATGNGVFSSASASATPIVPVSFDSIQTVTLGSLASSITFSSIPSTYTHLQIRGTSAGQDNTNVRMQFNSDTASNYAYHGLAAGSGYGSSVYANAAATQSFIMIFDQQLGGTTNWNGSITDILDYKNTNKYKTTKTFSGVDNNGGGFIYKQSGHWRSTSAISSITLFPVSNNFHIGTTFALYGIK